MWKKAPWDLIHVDKGPIKLFVFWMDKGALQIEFRLFKLFFVITFGLWSN
jgi:hypothetical protein